MRILHLITARAGSKGVPRKNLREIAGLSLVGYKAIAAQRSRHCDRLLISSDSPEIIEVAKRYGAEAPFVRPAHLATDQATSFAVISHALSYCEQQEKQSYDAVMLLEPSSPFATAQDLDRAVEIMTEKRASLVVGMVEHKINTVYIGEMASDGNIRPIIEGVGSLQNTNRQSKPKQYTMNGALYLFTWDGFREHGTIYFDRERSFGHLMDPFHSIEIDEEVDLKWAEFLVQNGHVDLSPWQAGAGTGVGAGGSAV